MNLNKKNIPSLLCLIFILFLANCSKQQKNFNSPFSAYPVEFKYPSEPAPQFQQLISQNASKVAVVLGGGPAGLLTALTLENSKKFDYILVFEKRPAYTRANIVSIKPEIFPYLKQLGVEDSLKQNALFAPNFQVYLDTKLIYQDIFRPSSFSPPFQFLEKPKSIFSFLAFPHYGIQIAQYENLLNKKAAKSSQIFIFEGKALITEKNPINKIFSLRYEPTRSENYGSFVIEHPELIVVTEGAKSETRKELNLPLKYTADPKEYWCNGTVSLKGIIGPDAPQSAAVLIQPYTSSAIYGFFLPKSQELFLNIKVLSRPENIHACLVESAYFLIVAEQEALGLKLPSHAWDLATDESKSLVIEVDHTYMPQAYAGKNLIFLGDAAGTGSPKGGLGINLVSSAYLGALHQLTANLANKDPQALQKYNEAVQGIVHYWHNWNPFNP